MTQRLNRETEAQIKIGDELTAIIAVTKGLKQGCSYHPHIFIHII